MVAALVIAAGKTGGQGSFEPMQTVGSISAIQRLVSVFQRAGIERVVLVCGENSRQAEKLAARMRAVCLRAPDDAQMLTNVKLGLAYLQDKCEAVLIAPVDVPLFTVETVQALIASRAEVGVPVYCKRAGHPLLLRAIHFPCVLDYAGEDGLAGAVRASGLTREMIDVADAGVLANIQKTGDLRNLVENHSLNTVRPEVRVRLVREKAFFGPGPMQLLLLTDETGSLRDTCRRMGVSYSKGFTMLALIEQQLGCAVLIRQQGGASGGQSTLTAAGKDLVKRYTAYCEELSQNAQTLFEQHFAGWAPGGGKK